MNKTLAFFSTKTLPKVLDNKKKQRHRQLTIFGKANPAPNTTSSNRGILKNQSSNPIVMQHKHILHTSIIIFKNERHSELVTSLYLMCKDMCSLTNCSQPSLRSPMVQTTLG